MGRIRASESAGADQQEVPAALSDSILAAIDDPFYAIDAEWRIVYANRRALQNWGFAATEVLGRRVWDRFPQLRDTEFGERLRAAIAARRTVEFEMVSPVSGQWVWLRVSPTRDGYAVVHWRNTTDQRRHEDVLAASLAASNARMQAFFDMSLDWLSLFRLGADREFRYLDLNPACAAAYGLSREAVIGQTLQSVLGPEQAIVPLHHLRECVRTGQPQRYQARRTMASVTRLIDVVFVPLVADAGAEPVVISTARDLTEREALESQLRQAQKMEAVGQLTGGVAHDFNNLLTAVISSLELILRRSSDPRVCQLAQTAFNAAMRGGQLTSQLLAFARKQTLQPTTADLDLLLRETDLLLRRAVGETIELVRETASGLWPVALDAAQFQASVMNLVVNARDAMPDGGRIVLAAENVTVSEAAAEPDLPPGDYVLLRVSDTGHGMNPEVLTHAFEPFFTTKELGKGSGLGLSMVHGFVMQSGGAVRIGSAPGRGTTVRLFLPRLPPSGRLRETAEETGTDARAPAARILFAEDNEDVNRAGTALLRAQGHLVTHARNGREALTLLQSGKAFDLLLSDVVMPGGLGGIDLARAARRLRPDLKILLTSGYAADAALQPGTEGEFPFIAKPFHPAALARRLRALLAG